MVMIEIIKHHAVHTIYQIPRQYQHILYDVQPLHRRLEDILRIISTKQQHAKAVQILLYRLPPLVLAHCSSDGFFSLADFEAGSG
jgi:hypothetical protein